MAYDPPAGTVMTAVSGGTATFNTAGNNETVYRTSGTLLASLSITLPSVSIAGQVLRYVSSGIITTVSVTGTVSAGLSVTTLAAGIPVAWQAINATGSFVRIV